MRSVLSLTGLSLMMLASCKGCDDSAKVGEIKDSAAPSSTPSAAWDAAPTTTHEDATIPPKPEVAVDGGVSGCRLSYGPAQQPFRGPASLVIQGQELRLVTNDNGSPRIFPIPIPPPTTPKNAPPITPPRPTTTAAMKWPPCEIAGRFAYCQGAGGTILRSVLGSAEPLVRQEPPLRQEPPRQVAKSRPKTRFAASALGSDHSVVAFLDVRRTSEGDMLQAFVVADDKDPVRLSDEGAGATTLRFLSRGESAMAIYLDARAAMVPVHARSVSLHGKELVLGADTVVYVGGAPERGLDFTVATIGASAYALLPMPRETIEFGMATLRIDDPPKEDIQAIWSLYPNGIDPAPIAAAPAKDATLGAWVARVRPQTKEVPSPRIIELGRIDSTGTFHSLGEIAQGRGVTDLGIVDDGVGVWILYGDSTVTWLERRICERGM